ncbi:MAG: FadR family transcriptional regulator [Betaproteobacteria bacterium]|nr:MAG: FadR family transcriptional regulator [Betaproteobacteria bacterium]
MKPPRPSASTYSGRNLHGQVVHELGRRIVGGSCPPGEALPNEEELCRELGVSRTALRRIGTRVRASASWNLLDPDVLAWRCATSPEPSFALQLNEMREIIEPASAALAARKRNQTQLRHIEDAYEAMAAATTIDEWVAADLEFHSAILDATSNPLLRPLAAMIGSALESLLGLSARKAGTNFKVALPDHARVLDAIRRQDGPRAMQHMAALLADTRALLLRPGPKAARKPVAKAPARRTPARATAR